MNGHPLFCVCDACSSKVAAEHRDGDEKLGRDWRAGAGCGCAACRAARATLDDIDPRFANIAQKQGELARIRRINRAFRNYPNASVDKGQKR